MTKKKVISLVCAFALVLTAIGGTLAYLTDKDKAENVFSVGSVDISLTETVEVNNGKTGDDKVIYANKVSTTNGTTTFSGLMPGNTIVKTPVVKNTGDQDAYVRVVVHINNQEKIYSLLKEYLKGEGTSVNDIFNGWNFTFEKIGDMRYTSTLSENSTYTTDGKTATLLYVDEGIQSHGGGNTLLTKSNHFKTEAEKNCTLPGFSQSEENRIIIHHDDLTSDVLNNLSDYIYYQGLVGCYKTDGVAWVYYLKMEPGSQFTAFNGVNVLDQFDADEMKAFDGLKISVCVDAIQAEGFADVDAAMEALNKTHPLTAWNIGNTN